jgi:hypothetical protein
MLDRLVHRPALGAPRESSPTIKVLTRKDSPDVEKVRSLCFLHDKSLFLPSEIAGVVGILSYGVEEEMLGRPVAEVLLGGQENLALLSKCLQGRILLMGKKVPMRSWDIVSASPHQPRLREWLGSCLMAWRKKCSADPS